MKKLMVTVMGICLCSGVFGQPIPEAVTDAVVIGLTDAVTVTEESSNAVLEAINSVLAAMEKIDNVRKNSDFVKTMKTVIKVKETLEFLICQEENLKIAVGRSVGLDNCYLKLRYSITLMNVELSNDLIKIITLQSAISGLSDKTLTSGDLLNILNDVCDNIQKSAQQIRSFISALESAHLETLLKKARMAEIERDKSLTYNRW